MKKKSKKKAVTIPKYSLSEELINSISHGVGAIFGIVALVITIVEAASKGSTIGIISASIYGTTMIIMYLMSCLYHAFSPKIKAKKVFRVIDHCDIFVFIAGCYTPISLAVIGGVTGWVIFAIIWLIAIVGVVLNAINLEKYQTFSTILYLLMGWMIILSFSTLKTAMPMIAIKLLIYGGIAYSVGAILYSIGSKVKYMHSVFHFFVLLGSILQFLCISISILNI